MQHPRVTVGGDSTISSVVGYLARCATTLGVPPLGTTDCFAKSLAIPSDLEAAIDITVAGKAAHVSPGQIGDDLFANAAATGMPLAINQSIPVWLKRRFGRAGYLIWGAYTLPNVRPLPHRKHT